MAFQIDPSIPLQANKVQFDPASIIMQAQQNAANLEKHRLEMQKLREDYDLAKEQRKQQKQMQMGIASDLAGIQSGTPAQYAPTRFEQQPQQPKSYTGDLMGGDFQLGGNNEQSGGFQLGGGEVTQEAVAGRQPTYPEMLQIGLKQAMLAQDDKKIMEYAKELNSIKKDTNKYFGGLTEAVDPVTQKPILLAMTETGAVPSGYAPRPKDGKAVPVMENGRPKTVKVPNTNEVKILMSDGTLMSGGSIPTLKPEKNADHPVYFNTTLTGDDFLKTLSPVDQAHVKALNEGREPFPTAKMMASNPYYERLADAVAQYNPDFDATAYNTRKTASAAFTTGIQGRQLLAFGSAVKHLETLGSLIDALENKDTVQLNRLNNVWKTQTGQNAVTNFESAKGIVAKEIMKSIVTGGGGVEERQELARLMDAAKSPQQLRGVVDTYHELMSAQKENLIIQRDAAGLPRSSLPDYTMHSADDNSGKDPYKITKGMNPDRVDYLMNHKKLVDMKDFEGAKMLTEIYLRRGAK